MVALNLAAPSASIVSTSIPPEASFSARARIPRSIRLWRCRGFSSSRASATAPAYPRQVRPNPFRLGRGKQVVLVSAEIDEIDALALEPLHQPAAVLGDSARQILARKALAA